MTRGRSPRPMRAILTAGLLLFATAPAMAHGGSHGLLLEDLVVVFNPLTQSQEFHFTLTNTDADDATGAIFGSYTMNDGALTGSVRVTGTSLAPGASADYIVPVPARIAAQGCIHVFGTATGTSLQSDQECAMSSGVAQAPIGVPTPPEAPEAPELPGEGEIPEDPSELVPEDPTSALPAEAQELISTVEDMLPTLP